MTQSIDIQIPAFTLTLPLHRVLALMQENGSTVTPNLAASMSIGMELQGGIYVGPMVEDGRLEHLIAAKETLDPIDWESAKIESSRYNAGGFQDWRLPTKSEVNVALAHAQSRLAPETHWTCSFSPAAHAAMAWAANFETGIVTLSNKDEKFWVRPFRRLTAG